MSHIFYEIEIMIKTYISHVFLRIQYKNVFS